MAIVKVGLVQMSCSENVAANKSKAIEKIKIVLKIDIVHKYQSSSVKEYILFPILNSIPTK